MYKPRITLDQWAALVAVVESGGYARAAAQLHKSQSTLSYAVQQIQRMSGVEVFRLQGRRAVLTDVGQALYRRGKRLLEEAESVEQLAGTLAKGWEPEVRVAVDVVFPTWRLLGCVSRLVGEMPRISVQIRETVLNGTHEAINEGQVDLGIGPVIPRGRLGDALMQVRFVPVAHPDHPLHRLGRELRMDDLYRQRRLVIRESGLGQDLRPTLEGDQRLTVSNKATSIRAACMKLGFAWYPEESVRAELDSGELKILPVRGGSARYATLYLMFADEDAAGPAARRFAALIKESVAESRGGHPLHGTGR